jgi:hypothetical protein
MLIICFEESSKRWCVYSQEKSIFLLFLIFLSVSSNTITPSLLIAN